MSEKQSKLELIDNVGAPYKTDTPYFYEFSGDKPGPTVTILGAVHGNEPIGVEVLEHLQVLAIQHGVQAGTLKLGIGNPTAYLQNVRGHDKNDANRFTDNPPGSNEEKCAQNLQQELKTSDVTLDIHETILPSEPMLIVPVLKHKYAHILKCLGIKTLHHGKGWYSPEGEAIQTDTYTAANGGFGVTIERGWKDDPEEEKQKIKSHIIKALIALGIFDPEKIYLEHDVEDIDEFEQYHAYQSIRAGKNFQWTKSYKNN